MALERNLARNIKRLREEKHVTQEQLAMELNLSFQAVSKWETGKTVPDTMMLPRIAQYFGTTIDNLFQGEAKFYSNNAHRLLAVYEASKNQDDFIRADAEFQKVFRQDAYTRKDIWAYGVLYEFHMYYCRDMALRQYDRLIDSGEQDDEYYYARCQKAILLSRLGRGQEAVSQERERLEKARTLKNYRCLIDACLWAEQYEEGYALFQEALATCAEEILAASPTERAGLYTLAGDLCRKMHKYEEAFDYWNQSLRISDEYGDALYSIAFAYHDISQYKEEAEALERLIDWLEEGGAMEETIKWPREMLAAARENLSKTTGSP